MLISAVYCKVQQCNNENEKCKGKETASVTWAVSSPGLYTVNFFPFEDVSC